MKIFNYTVYASESLGGSIEGAGIFQDVMAVADPCTRFGGLISAIITTLTVIGGIAFVIYFFVGALKWITAGGDKGKVAEAQSGMTQGAIGLIAIVSSYFIVGIVGAVLGLDILRPFNSLFGTGCTSSGSGGSSGGNYSQQYTLPNGKKVR